MRPLIVLAPRFVPARVSELPPVVPSVNAPEAVPAAVSKEMLVTLWLAEALATDPKAVLKRAVSAASGLAEPDQLPGVFQSPPVAPVHVTVAARADGRAARATATAIAARRFRFIGGVGADVDDGRSDTIFVSEEEEDFPGVWADWLFILICIVSVSLVSQMGNRQFVVFFALLCKARTSQCDGGCRKRAPLVPRNKIRITCGSG